MSSLSHVFDKNSDEWLTTINTDNGTTLYKRHNQLLHTETAARTNTVPQLKPYTPDPQYLDIGFLVRCDKQKSYFVHTEKNIAFDHVVFHGTIQGIDNYNDKTYLKVENQQQHRITVVADKNYKLNSSDTTTKLPAYLAEDVFLKLNIITDPTTKIFQRHNPEFETIQVDDTVIVSGKMKEYNQNRYVFPNNITIYLIPNKN